MPTSEFCLMRIKEQAREKTLAYWKIVQLLAHQKPQSWSTLYHLASVVYYPLANEVAMGYSNATIRPSFRNIPVNTLESTSFNGFWPNLVHI